MKALNKEPQALLVSNDTDLSDGHIRSVMGWFIERILHNFSPAGETTDVYEKLSVMSFWCVAR